MRGLACPVKNSGTEGLGAATDKPCGPRGIPNGFPSSEGPAGWPESRPFIARRPGIKKGRTVTRTVTMSSLGLPSDWPELP